MISDLFYLPLLIKLIRHSALTTELAPDASLTSGDVTTLPGPETVTSDPVSGNGGTASVQQTGSTQVDLTYDVSAQSDSFSGVMLHYDDFTTPATKETEDLSGLRSFIVGIRGPVGTKIKVEVEDVNGNKDFIILSGIILTDSFYEIRLDYFSSQIDFTAISSINFIVDGTLVTTTSGVITVTTASLS